MLVGNTGADALRGLDGDDTLVGGRGDDLYLPRGVGAEADTVTEQEGRGEDSLILDHESGWVDGPPPPPDAWQVDLATRGTVIAHADGHMVRTAPGLAANLENVYTGAADDVIRGNGRDNLLWSGGGHDLLAGRGGDDRYVLGRETQLGGEFGLGLPNAPATPDDIRIDELPDRGADTIDFLGVQFSEYGSAIVADLSRPTIASLTPVVVRAARPGAEANLEGLVGSVGDDRLFGNAADNVLDGRSGADVIGGASGVDRCLVDTSLDATRACERVAISLDPLTDPGGDVGELSVAGRQSRYAGEPAFWIRYERRRDVYLVGAVVTVRVCPIRCRARFELGRLTCAATCGIAVLGRSRPVEVKPGRPTRVWVPLFRPKLLSIEFQAGDDYVSARLPITAVLEVAGRSVRFEGQSMLVIPRLKVEAGRLPGLEKLFG